MKKTNLTLSVALSLILFAGCGDSATINVPKENILEEKPLEIVNTIPVATFDTFSINKDVRYDGQLTATDADGDMLKYIIIDAPTHGSVVLHDNGCFTYTPDVGYKGSDTFSYKASDDMSSCALKTVTVDVCEPTIQTPAAPSNLQVVALSTTKLELTWDDNSNNEEGFAIYQNGKLVANVNANKTKKIICCGLKAGTTYNFEVRAKNVAGVSEATSASGSTHDVTTAPTAPTELTAKAIGKTCLRLEWKDNADNESFHEIYKDGKLIKTISVGCHCTVVSGLLSDTTYTFMVKAVNKIGSSSSNTISVDTLSGEIIPPINQAPTADAGADQTVTVGDNVSLDGSSSSDSDGTIASYEWKEGATVLSTNATFSKANFTQGTHTLTLTVTDDDGATATDTVVITVNAETAYVCPANSTTESVFSDGFASSGHDDVDWNQDAYTALTVDQIAAAFNNARANDSTVTTNLQMPSQTEWDNMSESEKALYLINSERCARGIIVYEGIEPQVVSSPAQTYAEYISTHRTEFEANPHQADGRTPWERLTQDTGVIVNTNADFWGYAENIAYQAVASNTSYPTTVYETTAKSVYGWMYEDKDSSYGHRHFVLSTGLTENSGDNNMEGVIGIGQATENYQDGVWYWTRIYTVLNGFDPTTQWDSDLNNIIKVDIKP